MGSVPRMANLPPMDPQVMLNNRFESDGLPFRYASEQAADQGKH
jgi:hypothetical protein